MILELKIRCDYCGIEHHIRVKVSGKQVVWIEPDSPSCQIITYSIIEPDSIIEQGDRER